jgi:hypothetical protein
MHRIPHPAIPNSSFAHTCHVCGFVCVCVCARVCVLKLREGRRVRSNAEFSQDFRAHTQKNTRRKRKEKEKRNTHTHTHHVHGFRSQGRCCKDHFAGAIGHVSSDSRGHSRKFRGERCQQFEFDNDKLKTHTMYIHTQTKTHTPFILTDIHNSHTKPQCTNSRSSATTGRVDDRQNRK